MNSASPPNPAALSALLVLVFAGGAQAVSITPGFVQESRGKFEYNTGLINAGEDVQAAFTYFGAYPGHFDIISVNYTPDADWPNDSELAVETFNMNSYFWTGDGIAGTGRYFDFSNPFGRLRITATYQDVVPGSHIGNVNIKGLYVPDTGATLVLLGGSLAAVFGTRALRCKKR
jgi:hypothetical protein